MKRPLLLLVIAVAAGLGLAVYLGAFRGAAPSAGAARAGAVPAGRGGGGAAPLTVEVAAATRQSLAQQITVVGNLIGDATVAVVPRAAGRLQAVYVKLGDRVAAGQRIAQIENQEIREQVKQAEAALDVGDATIRQRDADLMLARTNVERSRNLFERQLLPKQTLDDNEARFQSAIAQVDLARAQRTQAKARLDELRVNLGNTEVVAPAEGFIARRDMDIGGYASPNAPIVELVSISRVRLTANVVEKDLRQLQAGDPTRVEVDAYPNETFAGRIARISPVLDPATRTATIEVEIPNGDFRLKPGMYARVGITTANRQDGLVVPANAVVDLGGRRGVFIPQNDVAIFKTVRVGIEQPDVTEVLSGVQEGDRVITTGAASLRDGDRIILAGEGRRPAGRGSRASESKPGAQSSAGGTTGPIASVAMRPAGRAS